MDSATLLPPRPEPSAAHTGLIDNALNIMQEFGQRAPFLSVGVSLLVGIGAYVVVASLQGHASSKTDF